MNLDLQKVLPAEAFETEQNEGDYIGKDGLLYCGVCRTKKQTRLPASDFTGGREIIVPCICKCKVEENKRKEEEEKKRQEMQRLERLKASSLMDAKLKAARLDGYQVDGDNQKIYNLAGNYVKKAAVQDSVTSNLEQTKENVKILVVSGERRGESKGRSKYNEIEIHRTNAPAKAHRIVHQWRPVIDYSERDIWEVLKRHNVNPHPCYRAGWNRCSCAMCIFSTPKLFAGIKEIYPEEFEALKRDEEILGFTLDNKCDLETFVGDAESCVYHGDFEALRSLITGEFTIDDVYVKGRWMYPAGAFHGAEGGPC